MTKTIKYINFKLVTITLVFLFLDLAIYLILGAAMMQYEDFYDESKGAYWSWESMTIFDKSVVVSLNFWYFINVVAAILVIRKIIKMLRKR
jgi:hypothetical protein